MGAAATIAAATASVSARLRQRFMTGSLLSFDRTP
jgi:hypothetical protein